MLVIFHPVLFLNNVLFSPGLDGAILMAFWSIKKKSASPVLKHWHFKAAITSGITTTEWAVNDVLGPAFAPAEEETDASDQLALMN